MQMQRLELVFFQMADHVCPQKDWGGVRCTCMYLCMYVHTYIHTYNTYVQYKVLICTDYIILYTVIRTP